MGSTTSSTSAAITAPPASIEPPGPKPFRPGPRSPAWPLGHKPSWDRPSCAVSRPEPIKLTVPSRLLPRRRVSSHPLRITASLPQPGQRTPSGQRCWRTSAKHLASSSKAERLTRSMAGMMAEAPRTSPSATPALAFRPDHPQPRAPSRPHHPERRQEPRTNVASYPAWQNWLRHQQPPLLVIWGRYDPSFQTAEAEAYRRDVPDAEVHVLDAGHFALDVKADEIAALTKDFLLRNSTEKGWHSGR